MAAKKRDFWLQETWTPGNNDESFKKFGRLGLFGGCGVVLSLTGVSKVISMIWRAHPDPWRETS